MPTLPARPLLYTAALASGAATLLYELAWLRLLTLTVGATWPAMTVVVSGFMAGIGLGGVLAGRWVDRDPSPARAARRYAGIEVLAPVAALGFWGLASLAAVLPEGAIGAVPLRSVAAGLALLVPTVVFGCTFPLLSAAVYRTDGAHLPPLYAANTAGALLGTVGGALVLPYLIGLPGTVAVASALNLLAAGLAWASARGVVEPAAPVAPEAVAAPAPAVGPVVSGGLLLALAAGSGMLTTLGELFWTRTLFQLDARLYQDQYLQPVDLFGVVLALLLFGQSAGAAWVATWRSEGLLPRLGATFAIGGALSLFGLEGVAVATVDALVGDDAPLRIALRLLGLVPAVVLLGASFPLLTRLFAGARLAHGRRLGQVWAVNTTGAVVGSVLGGAVVLGWLGSGGGLLLTAGLGLGLGALAMAAGGRRGLGLGTLAVGAVVVGGVAVAVPLTPGIALASSLGGAVVLDAWEGWEATTVVVGRPGRADGIASNGRYIQGRTGFRTRVDMLAQVAPDPGEVLLVGFGTGWLARGILDRLEPERLTIVEIDGAQFTAARWFETGSLLQDPRVDVIVDDALHYLAITDRRFDLVVVDAWGPDQAPLLYTRELHERALARSTERGLLSAKLTPLAEVGMGAVLDAAACAWPYAWLDRAAPPSLLAGRVDVTTRASLERSTCVEGQSRPLSVWWPVRLYPPFRTGGRPPPPR